MDHNMQTLKIEIPKGFEIDSFDKQSGEIKFKEKPLSVLDPRSVLDRIRTIDDVLADHKINRADFYDDCNRNLERDEIAYRILKLLAKSLNEGWVPDWSNINEYKYFPWFDMSKGSSCFRFAGSSDWHSYSLVVSHLGFKSRELAEHAAERFLSVYEDFMVIK